MKKFLKIGSKWDQMCYCRSDNDTPMAPVPLYYSSVQQFFILQIYVSLAIGYEKDTH